MMYERTEETRARILARDRQQREGQVGTFTGHTLTRVRGSQYGWDVTCHYADKADWTAPTTEGRRFIGN